MEIIKKIVEKSKNLKNAEAVTIAFLGDSVTQGCFECYLTETSLDTVFDERSSYSNRLKEILHILFPSVQINIINAGISGDNIHHGLERLERDILKYSPDLTVVSYGLNDSVNGLKNLNDYALSLKTVIERLKERGSEVIFLTQNYMNDHTSCFLRDELFIRLSKNFAEVQNSGCLTAYFERAKEVCAQNNVKVCDLHAVWKNLYDNGVNTTELLANKLNHPIREIHYYMAIKLLEVMFEN